MTSRTISALFMGSISLILFTVLAFITFGQSHPGSLWLWVSWIVSLASTAAVLSLTTTARGAWGYLSLIGGVISLVVMLSILLIPVSASAPYQPGADWLQNLDLAPPVDARLREAIASAYFGIAIIIGGMILLSAAYLLLHHLPHHTRHHAQ